MICQVGISPEGHDHTIRAADVPWAERVRFGRCPYDGVTGWQARGLDGEGEQSLTAYS